MSNVQLTGNQSDFLKIVVAAAGRGDLETVRQLVDDNPAWIHTVGSHGRTMLWEAAYRGKLEMVQFLLEHGRYNLPGCYHFQHRIEITPTVWHGMRARSRSGLSASAGCDTRHPYRRLSQRLRYRSSAS